VSAAAISASVGVTGHTTAASRRENAAFVPHNGCLMLAAGWTPCATCSLPLWCVQLACSLLVFASVLTSTSCLSLTLLPVTLLSFLQAVSAQQQLARGQMALETAVILLESVLPSLLEQAVLEGQGPGFKDSLVGLLQPLLGLRYTDPVMVALVSCLVPTLFLFLLR
jgi:hypothetical protein